MWTKAASVPTRGTTIATGVTIDLTGIIGIIGGGIIIATMGITGAGSAGATWVGSADTIGAGTTKTGGAAAGLMSTRHRCGSSE